MPVDFAVTHSLMEFYLKHKEKFTAGQFMTPEEREQLIVAWEQEEEEKEMAAMVEREKLEMSVAEATTVRKVGFFRSLAQIAFSVFSTD